MTKVLTSPQDAEFEIAKLTSGPCSICAREERAFGNQWFSLGTIFSPAVTYLEPQYSGIDNVSAKTRQRAQLVREGTFEWSLPCYADAKKTLVSLLNGATDDERVCRALDLVATIAVRTGLLHPVFDPAAIENMPFRRSTTIVSDTSGLLQGGLDFVVRHIPKARVKVPAIVQMEIRNMSHRFFKTRRDAAKVSATSPATVAPLPSKDEKRQEKRRKDAPRQRVRLLTEHLRSQGAERALLRLELQDDMEIERTYLFGDPLRNAFKPDRDSGLAELQLAVPVDAYVDRLILEAARHHQAQSEPGHPVLLLTSDQGQARMALAEGVKPLYFRAVDAQDLFGQRLTGRPLHPFTGEPRPVSLVSLLWELATAFGSVCLRGESGAFTVSALREDLPWNPYHSVDDLLWCEVMKDESRSSSMPDPASSSKDGSRLTVRDSTRVPLPATDPPITYQRMNVNRLLTLICALVDEVAVTEAEVMELLELSRHSVPRYRRFLTSAGYIDIEEDHWIAKDRLREVSIAMRNEDLQSMLASLRYAPSFQALAQRVEGLNMGELLDLSDLGEPSRTYRVLGELTLLCASAGKDAIYPTLNRPASVDFAQLALTRFRELATWEAIVPTGRWLEALIRKDGIHPEVARRSLEDASKAGMLRRSTEGSTPEMAFDDHVVHVLRIEEGTPVAKPIYLYRGDYLIPGKASVSLRIEEPKS